MKIETGEILERAVSEIIDREHLEALLRGGRKLRIKYGIDPTAPEIHLGHAVPIRKLKQFQDLGHKVIFIIGDYTARIGDPSGRLRTRTALSEKQVRANAATYLKQAFKILDPTKTEIHRQSEWFKKFNLASFLELVSKVSVSELLEHETFQLRIKKHLPFFLHEAVYPILQAYDSVAVKASLEIGGKDQKFNLLMGRHLQRIFNQEPQDIMMTPYLVGTDGKEKMSKTAGNYIAITASPDEMFGKLMSITDGQIIPYFEFCTDLTWEGLDEVKKELKKGTNPKLLKARLAYLVSEFYHSAPQAERAAAKFERVFGRRLLPEKMPTVKVSKKRIEIIDLILKSKLASSKSAARRLVEQKAVELDQKVVGSWKELINPRNGVVLRVGKRGFVRLKVND